MLDWTVPGGRCNNTNIPGLVIFSYSTPSSPRYFILRKIPFIFPNAENNKLCLIFPRIVICLAIWGACGWCIIFFLELFVKHQGWRWPQTQRLEIVQEPEWEPFDKWPWLNCETSPICLHNITPDKKFQFHFVSIRIALVNYELVTQNIHWMMMNRVFTLCTKCSCSLLAGYFAIFCQNWCLQHLSGGWGHYENQFLYLPSLSSLLMNWISGFRN